MTERLKQEEAKHCFAFYRVYTKFLVRVIKPLNTARLGTKNHCFLLRQKQNGVLKHFLTSCENDTAQIRYRLLPGTFVFSVNTISRKSAWHGGGHTLMISVRHNHLYHSPHVTPSKLLVIRFWDNRPTLALTLLLRCPIASPPPGPLYLMYVFIHM